jgi:hypothetical protein
LNNGHRHCSGCVRRLIVAGGLNKYLDQGRERYEEMQRQRSIASLRRRAAAMGFQIAPAAVPTA